MQYLKFQLIKKPTPGPSFTPRQHAVRLLLPRALLHLFLSQVKAEICRNIYFFDYAFYSTDKAPNVFAA